MKRSPLKRGTSQLKRTSALRRRSRRPVVALGRESWYSHVECCAKCGSMDRIEKHHILPAQTLRRNGWGPELFNPANKMYLCSICHAKHTNYFERIPASIIPVEAIEFVKEIGLLHLLEREYPGLGEGKLAKCFPPKSINKIKRG